MSQTDQRKYHVGLAPGEVGDYVLIPGDPFRTALIARHLVDARERAWSRVAVSYGSTATIALPACPRNTRLACVPKSAWCVVSGITTKCES